MNCYRYLPYTLMLESPAILTALGGDPNSASTLLFIPGSAVRGAVAKALGDPGEDARKKREFHDLILGGKVRYLNAYPEVADRRALPVPTSLRREKNSPNEAKLDWCQKGRAEEQIRCIDLAAFAGQRANGQALSEIWPEKQLTAIGEGFVTIGGERPMFVRPSMSARLHHQRDRQKGRAWKEVNEKGQEIPHGAIFAFEFLDAGQLFQGMIQVGAETEEECDHIESRLKELIPGPILVGRSRRGGYGGMAAIRWREHAEREVMGAGSEGWRPVSEDIPAEKQFRLLLTSACIARNSHTGQVDPAALENNLKELLGNRAGLIRKRWSFETVGGFNRKWRLETPQVPAVAAGSVFVFQATQTISFPELLRLEHEGLGERREEGYGRFLFLDAPLTTIYLYQPAEKTSFDNKNGEPPELVLEIEKRILAKQVVKNIEEKAAQWASKARQLPTNSLTGRLRVPLRKSPGEAIRTLQRWLDGQEKAEQFQDKTEKLKKPAMDQLERCRIDGKGNLKVWILEAIRQANVLEWLNLDVLAKQHHIVSEESAMNFLKERWEEWAIQLIDATLAGLASRNKTQEGGDEQTYV